MKQLLSLAMANIPLQPTPRDAQFGSDGLGM